LEAEEDEQTGRNENEPHLMSPEMLKTGDQPNRSLIGEGRREETGQQSKSSHRSGGVGVDGTSASSVKVSWEISGGGCQTQPFAQAGKTSQAGGVAGEVGILRSSDETPIMGVEPRRDTCPGVRREGGRWLRQEIRRRDEIIINPDFGLRPKGANPTGLGEPNMGKPSVRFDEGRERVGHWPCAFQSVLSCLLYHHPFLART
jgi:hypothetical protein